MEEMDEDEEDEELTGDFEEDEEEEDSSKRKNIDDEEEESDEENDEVLDNDNVQVQVKAAPKHVKCEEDDDFINMFDKMMNETLNETKVPVPRSHQLDIVAPVHLRQNKKYGNIFACFLKICKLQNYSLGDPSFPATEEPEETNTIQFAVLMRKGQKQTLREVAVPKDSDMAVNLLKQEQVQRLEKERMKKLTLEINERQEEEDLNEAIAMVIFKIFKDFSHFKNRKLCHFSDAKTWFGEHKS